MFFWIEIMKSPSRFFIGIAGTITVGFLATSSVQASPLNLQFLGQSIVPTGFIPSGPAGTVNGVSVPVGGLSGITYDPAANNFYIISDDRSQNGPARFYTATINPMLFNVNGTNSGVTFTGVTPLLQTNGQTFPALSLDPEGIALVGSNLYISSEGEVSNNQILDPFVNRFALANGQQNDTLPIPNQFIPAPNSIPTTSGVRNNLALESLTTTPDQRFLFTASENALVQDGPAATPTNGSPSSPLQYRSNRPSPDYSKPSRCQRTRRFTGT
jgi:glycerophosphoryl diester phosphodiesterase